MSVIELVIGKHFVDDSLDEVLINGTTAMILQYNGDRSRCLPSPFSGTQELVREVQHFSMRQGMRLDPLSPMSGGDFVCDVGGKKRQFRWHTMISPVTRDGALFSLRRHRFHEIGLDDFSITVEKTQMIMQALTVKKPIFICGPTGSGKTSFLSALLRLHCREERVLILEQLPEIPPLFPRWIQLIARAANLEGRGEVTLAELFTQALRLRPDRIVLGEVRGVEGRALYHSILSGHLGVLTTAHATSSRALLARLKQSDDPQSTVDWQQLFEIYKPCVVILERGTPNKVVSTQIFA